MERMLVAVFDSEADAYDGFRALQKLENEGTIAVYISRIVTRRDDGEIAVRNTEDPLPQATLGATALGTLLGLLGGPVGVAVGAATGLALGAATDRAHARLNREFVSEVARTLAPGTTALVAELDEESADLAGARLKDLGAIVFCRDLSAVADWAYERDTAALEARIARAEAAHASARAERKAKLKARIHALEEKRHRMLGNAM